MQCPVLTYGRARRCPVLTYAYACPYQSAVVARCRLPPYAHDTRCPVLKWRMLRSAYASDTPCPVLTCVWSDAGGDIYLRRRYAMSGTDLEYAAIRSQRFCSGVHGSIPAILL
eukprot:1737599-Rhodomonas_salina.3